MNACLPNFHINHQPAFIMVKHPHSVNMLKTLVIVVAAMLLKNPSYELASDCSVPSRFLNYYMLKSCYRSTSTLIFWKHVSSLKECKDLAREKSGLAFNFSPQDAENYTNAFVPNCQILGCPEFGINTSLKMDLGYDYYSAYGNMNETENSTCVKAVGLFALTQEYHNYSQSILACQNLTGDLADVSSEHRTVMLSQIIKNGLSSEWYKAVYVGLDDIAKEGSFQTVNGKLLTCTSYRAWAPGHPRSKHESEDCVTLDSERAWRTVNCNKVKLRALCELYPHAPGFRDNAPRNTSCANIFSKSKAAKRRKCLRQKQLFELFQNSSRPDRCAMLNYDEKWNKSNNLL